MRGVGVWGAVDLVQVRGKILSAGFDRLSDRSRYRRFLSPVPRLTSSMLDFLTSVDGINHRAWGALIDEPAGPVGAGVIRWVRSRTDPAVADMAVTVIDDYQGRGLGALLQDVLKSELDPYQDPLRQRIRLRGPQVNLQPSAVLALGLAVHELATNAVKYGSLSNHDGRLTVMWAAMSSPR